ncbi:MAG TPA: cation:proton antiporter, partial [Longimicrobium sp.]|nr:cation:proton antiporter [Longimicrobium sp.]
MHGSFLLGAGLILGALALAGALFLGLRQSVIPGFILLGLASRGVSHDHEIVDVLATLGVVLLLFSMGLEFSLGALLRNRRSIVRDGMIDWAWCFPAGVAAGLLFGWGWAGALIAGGAFYATSSAIVAKATIELRRAANPETEAALGVLVFEDLFVAVLLAVLSGAVAKGGASVGVVALGIGKAVLFFAVVVAAAHFGRPVLDRVFRVDSDDVFLLLAGAGMLLLSWAALAMGLSEAIGAFLAGLALAETRHRERAERLFAPLQGVFAAVFFFAFGLSLDPSAFGSVWPAALALTVLGLALKVGAGWTIGRRGGLPKRTSLALGLTLTPRGEFSIVLAGVAASAGLAGLNAAIGLMVLLLSLSGTVLLRFAPEVSRRAFP